MEAIEPSQPLASELENLRKLLLYRRETLLELSLSEISERLARLLKTPETLIGDLFLEFLMRFSYALLLKSRLLLNEALWEETLEEEPYPEERGRRTSLFGLYQAIPLERTFEDRVFLPKIDGFEERDLISERGDLQLLISAFLRVVERWQKETTLRLEFSQKNIEDYLENLRLFLQRERLFTWEDFLQALRIRDPLELILYFLGLLFLVYYGECGLYQDEKGIIQIFLRE